VRTAGPAALARSFLELTYTSNMRENQTSIVNLTYHVRSVFIRDPSQPKQSDVPDVSELTELEDPILVRLGSSGFKIDPKEDLRKERGASLPITQKWTITPEGEGTRVLLLRIESPRHATNWSQH
jgi:hypothetical protein